MSIQQAEREKEARENRWGIFCADFETCERYGICREECPNGGKQEDGDGE